MDRNAGPNPIHSQGSANYSAYAWTKLTITAEPASPTSGGVPLSLYKKCAEGGLSCNALTAFHFVGGFQFLQPMGDLQQDPAVPRIGREPYEVGILRSLDGIGDADALVERRQELKPAGIRPEFLRIGLRRAIEYGR